MQVQRFQAANEHRNLNPVSLLIWLYALLHGCTSWGMEHTILGVRIKHQIIPQKKKSTYSTKIQTLEKPNFYFMYTGGLI